MTAYIENSYTDNFQHLMHEVPNTDLNRMIVKTCNQYMRKSKSRYRLIVRYRQPKDGYKYKNGGRLGPINPRRKHTSQCEMANSFSVYLELTASAQREVNAMHRRRMDSNREYKERMKTEDKKMLQSIKEIVRWV